MLVFRNSTSRVLNHHNWWFETPKVDAAELQPLFSRDASIYNQHSEDKIVKYHENYLPICLVFIDSKKVFDSVSIASFEVSLYFFALGGRYTANANELCLYSRMRQRLLILVEKIANYPIHDGDNGSYVTLEFGRQTLIGKPLYVYDATPGVLMRDEETENYLFSGSERLHDQYVLPVITVWVRDMDNYRNFLDKITMFPTQHGKKIFYV
ncbi:hypothetical protein GQR58_011164 [Nymphon striatum]|nr:hypothetical protein GQR58_011164 [Nymphon striatum]